MPADNFTERISLNTNDRVTACLCNMTSSDLASLVDGPDDMAHIIHIIISSSPRLTVTFI